MDQHLWCPGLALSVLGLRGQGFNTGYLFTLNQDLWPERRLTTSMSTPSWPSLPGLRRLPGPRIFMGDVEQYSVRLVIQPADNPGQQGTLPGAFNVIKLHGSFNWQTADGRRAMIVGTEKSSQVEEAPLLKWYFDIFKCILSAGDVRLMIVGYGFGDEHVNNAIAHAIKNHGLKVFVWDVGSDIKERILAAKHGDDIWGGLLGAASRRMIEVFPSNQAETEEYRRIRTTFFD